MPLKSITDHDKLLLEFIRILLTIYKRFAISLLLYLY